MGKVAVDWVKGRAAIIAMVNAVLLVLAAIGKVSQDQVEQVTGKVGNLFDIILVISGPLAAVLPGLFSKEKKVAAK